MLLLSNYRLVCKLAAILNSLFFTVNAVGLPLETSNPSTGHNSGPVTVSVGPASNVDSSGTPIDSDADKSPIVKLVNTGDDYVVISTDILPKVGKVKCQLQIEYEIEIDNKWINGKDRPEPVKSIKMSAKVNGARALVDWKVGPLKPSTNYRFYVYSIYEGKKYPASESDALEVTTKPLAPKTTLTKRLNVLTFEDSNVKTYHVQITKVKEEEKQAECIFEVKMSPCIGKELTLPELTSGSDYTIKTWYTDVNDKESEPQLIHHKF